jgi:superoxide dismutase, Cu-Zn family
MKYLIPSITALALAAGITTAGQAQTPAVAAANLVDADGRRVGEARLREATGGVLLELTLTNATPGIHGLHIHDVGRCDAPTFESAGGHFNPTKRQHGFLNTGGPHAGDLPNIDVPTSKALVVEYFVPNVTLGKGNTSLLDGNGSAIVIHSGKDDYKTDPSGDSGARLACGQISQK